MSYAYNQSSVLVGSYTLQHHAVIEKLSFYFNVALILLFTAVVSEPSLNVSLSEAAPTTNIVDTTSTKVSKSIIGKCLSRLWNRRVIVTFRKL